MPNVINATSTGNGGLVSTGDDSGILNIQTNETTAITVDASQNVGIGTSSPSTKLAVVQNQNGASQVSISNNTGGASSQALFSATDGTNYGQFGMWGSGVSASGAQQPSNAFVYGSGGISYFTGGTHRWYYSTNTEAMRIVSSGELVVGGTTAGGVGTSIAAPDSGGIYCNTATTGLRNQIRFVNPNGTVGSIQTNGSATSYNTSSDYRLKENIVPMTGALAKVAQLKPVTYKWKADGSDGEGFIAHELQTIKPDCVSGNKDAVETYTDEGGNEATRPAYQGIDTSFLVATLTSAIQELKAINDTQAETINALTARIVALEQA